MWSWVNLLEFCVSLSPLWTLLLLMVQFVAQGSGVARGGGGVRGWGWGKRERGGECSPKTCCEDCWIGGWVVRRMGIICCAVVILVVQLSGEGGGGAGCWGGAGGSMHRWGGGQVEACTGHNLHAVEPWWPASCACAWNSPSHHNRPHKEGHIVWSCIRRLMGL